MRLLYATFLIVISTFLQLNAQTYTIILGRPTDTSITMSIVFDANVDVVVNCGLSPTTLNLAEVSGQALAGKPLRLTLTGLQPNKKHHYQLSYSKAKGSGSDLSPLYTFHTQRAKGEPFTFLVEADEHLYDKKGIRSLYSICLDNQAKDSADFMISLGDTFGDDHTPELTTSQDMDDLHRDYLQYLGKVCHSMPFFFCLGNHEGETGYYLKQNAPNNIAVWGTLWRKYYYPNPYPDGFYTGNMVQEAHGIAYPENYYAFTWGDALFVVLDVYRHCDVNAKPQNWDWTLGETQYRWMRQTLETSNAMYKFVFAHHTRGQGRGGISTAKGAEWGGYTSNKGQYDFDRYRPGWGLPIHDVMVRTGVNIFFQGHDHLYARDELDGVVYQTVPMPSDSTYAIGMTDNGDAYSGVKMEGSGHLRVRIDDDSTSVEFVRAWLPKDTLGGTHRNGEVGDAYAVRQRLTGIDEVTPRDVIAIMPNPAAQILYIEMSDPDSEPTVRITDMRGTVVHEGTSTTVDVSALSRGAYVVDVRTATQRHCQQIILGRE